MKADVLLKYHQILAKRGPAEASLYFASQFEGSEWREDEALPEKADYMTRSRHEAIQESRQREGMLLACQYYLQALASNDPVVKVRALSGRWRTMLWLAKELFDRRGNYTNNDVRRRVTSEIRTSIEWRIALRAVGFPKDGYWPRRLFEKGVESSIIESERWHFERILTAGNRRYRDRLERFSGNGALLWALGVIAELGLDGKFVPERALELYEKALAAGCSWASWRLGDMLAAAGKTQEARAAYEAGAALGHPLAKLKLALCRGGDALDAVSVELLVSAARAGVGDAWHILRNFLSAQDVEGGLPDVELETMEMVAVDLCSSRAIRDAVKQEKPDQDRYQRGRELDRLWGLLSKSQCAQDCYDAALHYLTAGGNGADSIYRLFFRAARLGSADAQYHLGRFYDPGISAFGCCSYARDAEKSYEGKDPLVAFMWYEKAATNGSADARYALAGYYKNGKIVSRDDEKCYELTLLAAEAMHRRALLDVAAYANNGCGCEKNVQLAIKCYKKILSFPMASEKDKESRGIAQVAARELARIYDGEGGPKVEDAFEYYSLAANIYDDPEAHRKLSEWYETGTGVAQDVNKASEHLIKYLCARCDSFEQRVAARVNHHKVYHNYPFKEVEDMPVEVVRCVEIAYAYESGVQVHSYCPESQSEQVLVPDEAEAFKWYGRAYKMGAGVAGLRCAEMLISGIGCDRDVMRARDIYVDLAGDDLLEASLALAKMYSAGLLVESGGANCSMYWLLKASELGDEYSRYLIGMEYESPNGAGRDMAKAIGWYKLSHCEDAYLRLAHCYRDGDGVAEDRKVAAQYYRLCSSITARIEFSNMCVEQGERLWQDSQCRAESFRWYLRAARLKNPKGQLRVAELYLHGNVVGVSPAKAACWNYWAAECHEAEGQWRFGAMCELGLGVERSLDVAQRYYRMAADQGHALAKLRLIELGCLPWRAIDAIADSGVPEACYIRGMSAVLPIGGGNASPCDLESAVHDLETAAKAGVHEALYGLYLCKMADSTAVCRSSDELLANAINKGSRYALLCWTKKMIGDGSPDEAIPKLWELYADGYKDAAGLLRDAYGRICRVIQSDDAHVAIQRKVSVNEYLDARMAALEPLHDKGKLSFLLWSFVSAKNNAVVDVDHRTFNIKFNAYRKEPAVPYYPDPVDYDDRDDYMPRTFEDAYEIYGSRLWDA